MNIRKTISLAAASIMFAACQTDSYRIEGSSNALSEGDTIFLWIDRCNDAPIDTAIVKEGKFVLDGKAETTNFGMVSCTEPALPILPLFIEPGRIKVRLEQNPLEASVGGTLNNNRLQSLMDSTTSIGIEIGQLAAQIYHSKPNHAERLALIDSIAILNKQFTKIIINHARKNADNYFGRFIVTYYSDFLDIKTIDEIIGMMPEATRNSEDIQKLQKANN